MTIGRTWRDAMQGERMSHSKAMAATNNAAVCPPDAIQVLQLFMNDSLHYEITNQSKARTINCFNFLLRLVSLKTILLQALGCASVKCIDSQFFHPSACDQ
ncbi:hypothetical protein [Nitrosomonas sp.]|uniref:hypothetical protein n=1 Tax=Nitrosomonas sp. TaxID=42353 RepID=UPI0025DE06A0|nr:hypothetical protein [Nitrosomonas sp.]